MRKAFLVMLGALIVPLSAAVHGAEVDDSHTLRLYNWADYIGEKPLLTFRKPPASG